MSQHLKAEQEELEGKPVCKDQKAECEALGRDVKSKLILMAA